MPHVATTVPELLERLGAAAHLDADRLIVDDPAAFRGDVVRDLAWTAAFATDGPVVAAAQWLIHEAARELGARSASIQELYIARARGEVSGFTVPAINLRAQTFDMARTVYETAAAADVGAVILELARSEQTYTFQRPADYSAAVLAGAIAAGWQGPVFLQGDHYQFNAKKYADDPEAMTEEIRRACRLAIDAGYRNIDIDSSTLVDLSKPTLDEQQHENYARAAELTALIRSLETDGVTVSVGGEIGEVGKKNSTEDELRAYLAGYRRELDARAPGAIGISKVSVQTGTSHGGVPLPDGSMAEVKLDFEVIRRLGEVAREHGLAGAVQHGASTLPGRAVPPLPGGRDGRDPPRDRVPERALRAPRVPGGAAQQDRGVGLRERARRAQARPDRRAVRLHDAQEGDRAVQARALGALDEGRDPRRPAPQDRVPVHGARRERVAGDGRALHPAGRTAPADAGRAPRDRGRDPGLSSWPIARRRGCSSGRRRRPTPPRSTASSSRRSAIRRSRR